MVSELQASMPRAAAIEDESEEDTPSGSRAKKAKADATQTARQAEVREKEKEREKQRAEAAGRRQERAGRRRGDGELGQLLWRNVQADRESRSRTRGDPKAKRKCQNITSTLLTTSQPTYADH